MGVGCIVWWLWLEGCGLEVVAVVAWRLWLEGCGLEVIAVVTVVADVA